MPKRITVTLRDGDAGHLDEVTDATRLSQNDAIRRALATEAFVQRTLGEGRRLLVESPDGTVREIHFVT